MQLAEALQEWIHDVIQSVECFYSSDDIRAGQRWNAEINTQLADTDFGILCVTAENLTAPWLNFEAGALSKKVDESRVVPMTLGFPPSRLEDPLKQFNGVEASKEGAKKLIASIAEVAKTQINLDRTFDRWWPDLEERISAIPGADKDVEIPQPPDPSEQLAEILGIVRGLAREIKAGSQERLLLEQLVAINRIAPNNKPLWSSLESNRIGAGGLSTSREFLRGVLSKIDDAEVAARLLHELERDVERATDLGDPGDPFVKHPEQE